MVFNATFSNISIISWRSVLLLEENKVHVLEKTIDMSQVTDKLYQISIWIFNVYHFTNQSIWVNKLFINICFFLHGYIFINTI
jgi:hypothetical protein